MVHMDEREDILEWSSEEIIVPYMSPLDGRIHRYFPDFWLRIKDPQGKVHEILAEVKPFQQCSPPPRPPKITKRYIRELSTFAVNNAKWEAAKSYANTKGMLFEILTEKDIFKKQKF